MLHVPNGLNGRLVHLALLSTGMPIVFPQVTSAALGCGSILPWTISNLACELTGPRGMSRRRAISAGFNPCCQNAMHKALSPGSLLVRQKVLIQELFQRPGAGVGEGVAGQPGLPRGAASRFGIGPG
jgi:hypothetical protein